MKAFCIVLICLTTLALAGYPFALVADIMAVASIQPGQSLDSATRLFFWAFVGGTFFYPLPYLAGLVGAIWNFRKNIRAALFWQLGVVAYLVVIGVAVLISLYLG